MEYIKFESFPRSTNNFWPMALSVAKVEASLKSDTVRSYPAGSLPVRVSWSPGPFDLADVTSSVQIVGHCGECYKMAERPPALWQSHSATSSERPRATSIRL